MKHLVSFFLLMSTLLISAQDNVVQTSVNGLLSHNQNQISTLANAFTEEQYDWRPAEGVRSVGEVILHTAAANYFLVSKLGFPIPSDVDMAGMEKIKGKQQILDALNKSFAYAIEKIGATKSDDFSKEIDLGFNKLTTVATMMVVLEHTGEHKGQLIAYARANGITPPWSN
ncbi:DinB family protein [Confluentibacter citreus]|uniref:DinB family protein n=1 Tax=Confluentibacter citreus TaxID=2007307 RepID=UPI000C2853CA|nr:DinB family protein [Confluentibacter citreus]